MPSKWPVNIFQHCVSLEDIEPRVWRRILVPDSLTLMQLHRVIQIVMGWQNSHLHDFTLCGKRYGESNPENEENLIDECTVRLRDIPFSIGGSMSYAYDFGDDWRHQLVLEKSAPADSGAVYPACIAGERRASKLRRGWCTSTAASGS